MLAPCTRKTLFVLAGFGARNASVNSVGRDAVAQDLRDTITACDRHGCPLELILKDISTVRYQPQRLWEWADVAMRLVGA